MNAFSKFVADRRATGILWLGLRLLLAYEWLSAGLEKVQEAAWVGDKVPTGIHGFLAGAVGKAGGAHPAVFGWYADFIKTVALPNEYLFSYMVAFGEILVGVALLVGLFTKWAAFWGAMMNLAFLLAGSTSSNGYMLVMEVAMVFGGLGVSFYGLDTFVLPYLKKLLSARTHHEVRPTPTLKPGSAAVH